MMMGDHYYLQTLGALNYYFSPSLFKTYTSLTENSIRQVSIPDLYQTYTSLTENSIRQLQASYSTHTYNKQFFYIYFSLVIFVECKMVWENTERRQEKRVITIINTHKGNINCTFSNSRPDLTFNHFWGNIL